MLPFWAATLSTTATDKMLASARKLLELGNKTILSKSAPALICVVDS